MDCSKLSLLFQDLVGRIFLSGEAESLGPCAWAASKDKGVPKSLSLALYWRYKGKLVGHNE